MDDHTRMKRELVMISATLHADATNPILFATQSPIAADFTAAIQTDMVRFE